MEKVLLILHQRNIISPQQCGFLKNFSTLTHLIGLKEEILDDFGDKCSVVSIFFDLEKAYDTA